VAKVTGWAGNYNVIDWDHEIFILRPAQNNVPDDDMGLEPLRVKLWDHEMQAWVKDPKGMDAKFEPDLVRPGKFKVRSIAGR
jgi:hypothetical protein